MKATVEMSVLLLKAPEELAQRSQTTLVPLIDERQRRAISDLQVKVKSVFKLKDMSVGGKGVLAAEPAHWQQLEEQHVIGRVLPRKAKRLA